MNINWKVRIRNKDFWLAMIPAILLVVQAVAAIFGYELDLGELGNNLIGVVNAVFVVLVLLGIVTDPTTEGIGDSAQAMTYEEPRRSIAPLQPTEMTEAEARKAIAEGYEGQEEFEEKEGEGDE